METTKICGIVYDETSIEYEEFEGHLISTFQCADGQFCATVQFGKDQAWETPRKHPTRAEAGDHAKESVKAKVAEQVPADPQDTAKLLSQTVHSITKLLERECHAAVSHYAASKISWSPLTKKLIEKSCKKRVKDLYLKLGMRLEVMPRVEVVYENGTVFAVLHPAKKLKGGGGSDAVN